MLSSIFFKTSKAAKYFLQKWVGLPGIVIWLMQWMPAWKHMKQTVHTLGDYCSGKFLNAAKWSNVHIPTLVISGTKSEMWTQNSMKQLAVVLPNATHTDLLNQTHMVKPKILAPMLNDFFRARVF